MFREVKGREAAPSGARERERVVNTFHQPVPRTKSRGTLGEVAQWQSVRMKPSHRSRQR